MIRTGRLFWKFFGFLFLAQITTALFVGLLFYWQEHQRHLENNQASARWPDRNAVATAASVLKTGQPEILASLLKDWQQRRVPQVYAIDGNGHELLGRSISPSLHEKIKSEASTDENAFVRRVQLKNQSYILFVPVHFFDDSRQQADTRNPKTANDRENSHAFSDSPPVPPPEFDHPPGPPPDMLGPEPNGPPPLTANSRIGPPPRGPMFPTKPIMVGTLASLFFAWLLAAYFAKPIRLLKSAFTKASEGELSVRVRQDMGARQDELADLGRDFDQMAERLGQLIQGQTRLLHHVSHELRSPLARMQMALGLAQQNKNNIQSSLERIEREAGRMDNMIRELLELSRLESGVTHLKKEPIAIQSLLATIVEDAQYEAQTKQIHLSLHVNDLLEVNGQADLLYRAIENVVRNAIKYGPEGSTISIRCHYEPTPPEVRILVQDEGEGVLNEELEEIFKPFVRGHSGSQTVGHGVGLAITKQVIESHGGIVRATNLKPIGFGVEILLPLSTLAD